MDKKAIEIGIRVRISELQQLLAYTAEQHDHEAAWVAKLLKNELEVEQRRLATLLERPVGQQ